MKLNLKLGTPRTLTRAEAWGCVTANLAVPGSGSLAAGRAVGYAQMAVYFVGFIMTLVCAASYLHWYLANSKAYEKMQEDDPTGALLLLLRRMVPILAAIAIAAFAMAWAAFTSSQIMRSCPKQPAPPRDS